MLAMQYSFTFPADYPMDIIRQRIANNGHKTDDFPGLIFKTYLMSKKTGPDTENRYAPFYLWKDAEAMNGFLTHPGFMRLSQDFGWPSVRIWSVLTEKRLPSLIHAHHATRVLTSLPPYTDLADLRANEAERAAKDVDDGALAAVTALEPVTWTLVRFRLWTEPPTSSPATTTYDVGHVSVMAGFEEPVSKRVE